MIPSFTVVHWSIKSHSEACYEWNYYMLFHVLYRCNNKGQANEWQWGSVIPAEESCGLICFPKQGAPFCNWLAISDKSIYRSEWRSIVRLFPTRPPCGLETTYCRSQAGTSESNRRPENQPQICSAPRLLLSFSKAVYKVKGTKQAIDKQGRTSLKW